jgi:hypothetical protein
MLIAAHRPGLWIALIALQRAPPNSAGGADAKAFCRLATRKTFGDRRHNTHPKIKRKAGCSCMPASFASKCLENALKACSGGLGLLRSATVLDGPNFDQFEFAPGDSPIGGIDIHASVICAD